MTAEVKKCDSLEFAAKAAAKTMKKPFSLTYLLYDEGDLLGYVMCIFSLLPILIMFSYGILLMFRRELHILSLTLGQLLNDGPYFPSQSQNPYVVCGILTLNGASHLSLDEEVDKTTSP